MRHVEFGVHFEALGLEPGASDPDIARAKRAFNELYHSDRLAHMSGAAQAIAALKVRAANEAARILLDPSLRAARDEWVRTRSVPGGARAPKPERPEAPVDTRSSSAGEVPAPGRVGHVARLVTGAIAVGTLLGTGAFLVQRSPQRPGSSPVVPPESTPAPASVAAAPPSPTRPVPAAIRSVVDSVITLDADGGWTAPVLVGGSYLATFIPELDNVMYRVRTNGTREYVLNSEPGFMQISEAVRTYEFSSLTGTSVRVRYTRWHRSSPRGTVLHIRNITLPADGGWSQRIWLGPIGFRWEVNRRVGYEVRDDEGRIVKVPPTVQSIAFGRQPVWIRFRSIDSLPLGLTFTYTVP